ncbi:hypothetical protein ZWY2020_048266 [Hordeum vulgare]|nr:hypothetical protein ZWY2020_048266 [Hordeum vulgare]
MRSCLPSGFVATGAREPGVLGALASIIWFCFLGALASGGKLYQVLCSWPKAIDWWGSQCLQRSVGIKRSNRNHRSW